MRKSNAVISPEFKGEFHKSCLSQLQLKQRNNEVALYSPKVVKCPVCKREAGEVPYTVTTSPLRTSVRCKSCGHYFDKTLDYSEWPYSTCYFCSNILEKSKAVKFNNPDSSVYIRSGKAAEYAICHAHRDCFEIPNNKERVRQAEYKIRLHDYWHPYKSRNWKYNNKPTIGSLISLLIKSSILVGLIIGGFKLGQLHPALTLVGFIPLIYFAKEVVKFIRCNFDF